MLGVQLVTGIVLAMHYTPHVDYAFDSVERIMRDVNYGWLLRCRRTFRNSCARPPSIC